MSCSRAKHASCSRKVSPSWSRGKCVSWSSAYLILNQEDGCLPDEEEDHSVIQKDLPPCHQGRAFCSTGRAASRATRATVRVLAVMGPPHQYLVRQKRDPVAKMKEMCGGDSCDPETFVIRVWNFTFHKITKFTSPFKLKRAASIPKNPNPSRDPSRRGVMNALH